MNDEIDQLRLAQMDRYVIAHMMPELHHDVIHLWQSGNSAAETLLIIQQLYSALPHAVIEAATLLRRLGRPPSGCQGCG